LKKGDLGGFKNHQWEGIFGKRYSTRILTEFLLEALSAQARQPH
jgi:hypothetical protein